MQKNKVLLIVAITIGIVALVAGAFFYMQKNNNQEEPEPQTQITESTTKDIVQIVGETPDLSTVSELIKLADVISSLEATGPFTFFAPTNKGFNDLPDGTFDMLKNQENSQALKNILNYHIVQGKLSAEQLTNGQRLKTINDQEITVEVTNGKLYIVDAKGNKAAVNKANVTTSNGVIHVITGVLLPQ